jgi:hypothetical protein
MSTETIHQILLDELSLKKAYANKQLKVLGPFWRAAPLAEILEAGREYYPDIVTDMD